MDATDLRLSLLLLANSRRPFRGLADDLGLSVPAVHKRIQGMRDAGVIRAFRGRVSLAALGAIQVLLFGPSRAPSVPEVAARLRDQGSVYWLAVAGGNYFYVGAYLRSIAELDGVAASVAGAAQMPDPTVGILSPSLIGPLPGAKPATLTHLDYQIIRALHRDSRKPIADVAVEAGVSAKTASRRLAQMVRSGAIELSLEWHPDTASDIITAYHVTVRSPEDRAKVTALLYNEFGANALFAWTFSNLPSQMMLVSWTGDMKAMQAMQARFQNDPAVERVVPNVLYTGFMFDTWRDALVLSAAKAPRRGR